MAIHLVDGAMDFSRRRRRWLLLLAAAGVSGYGAYRVYHHPSVSKKRRQLAAIFRALISVAEAASSTAEVLALVSHDLNLFLRSDSNEIPTSLKQLAKITSSEEFSNSVSRVSEALTVGVVRGFSSASPGEKAVSKSGSFSDRIIDKLLSERGSGFVSVVVGSFARNLVLTFYSSEDSGVGSDSDQTSTLGWVRLMCSEDCRELTADCIQIFVKTAVAVYLEKTMEVNTYDELFSGLTNPKHEAKVKDMLVTVCNGAVETLVKTSHRVINDVSLSSSANGVKEYNQEDDVHDEHNKTNSYDHMVDGGGGWFDRVSSTLTVPRNRRLLLDVTGRVTFETVRSLLDFILWKLYDGARRSVNVVHSEVVERGMEVVRYCSAKTMAIFTICITLCMHLVTRTRFMMLA